MSEDANQLFEKYAETPVTVWTTEFPRASVDMQWSAHKVFAGLRPAISFIKSNSEKSWYFDVHVHSPDKDIVLLGNQVAMLVTAI